MTEAASSPLIHIFGDAEELAAGVAERFIQIAREAVEARGRFSVALAGGSTPRRVYELLASEERRARLDWSKAHIFFGDERSVPPNHPDSNYRMAAETLLARVPVPARNVHRMRGEGDAEEAARLYEATLRDFFGELDWPRFDLVMLGMGEDGHTASLFPDTSALAERKAWVAANRVEKLNTTRLTLTVPALNHAAHLLFLVSGARKALRLKEVIENAKKVASDGSGESSDRPPIPAALIRPLRGTLEWFVDGEAAAYLR